jgi:hypothetical protein
MAKKRIGSSNKALKNLDSPLTSLIRLPFDGGKHNKPAEGAFSFSLYLFHSLSFLSGRLSQEFAIMYVK